MFVALLRVWNCLLHSSIAEKQLVIIGTSLVLELCHFLSSFHQGLGGHSRMARTEWDGDKEEELVGALGLVDTLLPTWVQTPTFNLSPTPVKSTAK